MFTIAGVALGAAAAGAIMIPLAWRLFRRNQVLTEEADQRAGEALRQARLAGRLAAVLDGASDGYVAWTIPDGGEFLSPVLLRALDLPAEAGFEQLLAALSEQEREPFDAAVQRLRAVGAAFSRAVTSANGASLRAFGRRVTGPDGAPAADVVWMIDRSVDAAVAAQLREAIAAAVGEREQLQATLDALPLPVWRRDADLALMWCNAAYAAATDGAPDDVVADQRELVPGGQDGRLIAERAASTQKPAADRRHVVIGGARHLLEITEQPVGQELVGFARDVTELEEVQATLARHLGAHAEVLESLASAIAIYGRDTRLIFFNQSFARLWRLEAAWLMTKPLISEVLEAMREKRRLPEYVDFRAFKAETIALFTSLVEPRDDLMHLPDDTTLRTLVAPHPLGGLMFLFEDVTDRMALERSYNTLTEVQRETLNNLHEGVAVFGGDGRLRLSNPEFARMWNLTPDDLADGPHISDIVEKTRGLFADVADWPRRRAQIIARITEPEPRAGRIERTDQKVIDYALTPLPDGAALLTYLDVTDRFRVERALRERNMALEAADRLKTEFIANVSYELRTPLNAIIGFTEILANEFFGPLNDRQKEYTRSILASSHGLRTLINDILDLATIEAGYMELELGQVDVQALLNSVLQLTRERGRERDLTIAVDCPEPLGTISGDERRLKQALFNLVSNAIKFTPPGGRITLSARADAEGLTLSVVDTGIGIPVEDQDRVFEKFERGAGQGRQAGAGLGLALVKSLIELHGGQVQLHSARGAGTTVTCRLPGAAPRNGDGAPAASDAASGTG
ncbi:MAG: ATP-binding protein [Alphaproteobacteria bacterium]|nr:ATP-binding protein [Alphaproteobacteria bacterium]